MKTSTLWEDTFFVYAAQEQEQIKETQHWSRDTTWYIRSMWSRSEQGQRVNAAEFADNFNRNFQKKKV